MKNSEKINKYYENNSHNIYSLEKTRKILIIWTDMRTHKYRDVICDTCHCRHLSAEDIFLELKKKEPNIGRATVYRNIEAMAENGVLRRFPGINGKTYYECNDETHAHLVDEKTGIFCDFPMENITVQWIPEGYELLEVRLQIRKTEND